MNADTRIKIRGTAKFSDNELAAMINEFNDDELDCLLRDLIEEHGRAPYGSHEHLRWAIDHYRYL